MRAHAFAVLTCNADGHVITIQIRMARIVDFHLVRSLVQYNLEVVSDFVEVVVRNHVPADDVSPVWGRAHYTIRNLSQVGCLWIQVSMSSQNHVGTVLIKIICIVIITPLSIKTDGAIGADVNDVVISSVECKRERQGHFCVIVIAVAEVSVNGERAESVSRRDLLARRFHFHGVTI